MSISTQPAARHASLQRALSARLNAPIGMDTAVLRTGPADKIQRPEVTTMESESRSHQLGNSAAHTLCRDGSSSRQLTELPAQGLLPAIASELASQIEARKRASLNCQPTYISESGQAYLEADGVSEGSALLKQSSKRPRFSPVSYTDIRLAQQAASLEDEFAAMKAGTAVIADKAAWIAAARHTAHQLQEEAQSKVLKAFKAALRYMDEQTLQSHMAMHLQLQPSTKEEDVDAQGASTSLQAPQALSCPRKPRSRRCPRPASAASLGLPREPSVSRPVSAPAQRSGWDWGQDLPSATSALLQAVEVAAAAEPGGELLPSPPSWKQQQQQDVYLPSLHVYAPHNQADNATAAVAAPASLLALASDAHSHLPEQKAGDHGPKVGGKIAASGSFEVEDSQAPAPVFHPAVQRPSQQGFTMASPPPEHSKGAQLADRADAECAVHSAPSQGLASVLALSNSGALVGLPSADQVWHWEQHPKPGPKPAAGSSQPGQVGQPNSFMPLLPSPFAAAAALPMYNQPTQTAAAQDTPSASASGQLVDTQVPGPSTDAEAVAQAAAQAHPPHAQQSMLGPSKMPQQHQKLHRERPPSGLGKKAQPSIGLPLSPSSVRSNGEASVLQPLAKGQPGLAGASRGLHGSSGRPQGLHLLHDCKLGLKASQPVCHSELLPGRNVVVSNAGVTDLAHLLIPPYQWCWVARIDKVLMSHMRVSWYGKHNGRWTLARHVAGPDEGQVRTGDVAISDQILAVFDRFTGNKEVPAEIIISAVAQLASFEPTATARAGDQENRILACV